ncbi:MAG TPA: hypothetical protein PK916_09100 [Bacteroidota bacterium]|nr:hypothetical protein [Bacteroidota bacterium]
MNSQRYWMLDDARIMPRRMKKILCGKRQSKNALIKRIAGVQIIGPADGQNAPDLSEYFCIKCGCSTSVSGMNMVEYPDRWVVDRCMRCGEKTWESDNSPFYHPLHDILYDRLVAEGGGE